MKNSRGALAVKLKHKIFSYRGRNCLADKALWRHIHEVVNAAGFWILRML